MASSEERAESGENAQVRPGLPLVVSLGVFVLVALESAWLRWHVAPTFGAMFDDFGGRDLLPSWTLAWTYGLSPYVVAQSVAALILIATVLAWIRRRPRWYRLTLPLGIVLLGAHPVLAFVAFYLPIFATS